MDQAVKYDINRTVLFGSYAKGTVDRLSDIDLMVDGKNRGGMTFFGLLEDVNNASVKSVDLIHFFQINKNSDIHERIMKGIVLYER
jgi:uncharacterized protein